MHFNITSPDVPSFGEQCDLAFNSTKPRVMSFWGVRCLHNNWTVSWGYTHVKDAAVMTLIK